LAEAPLIDAENLFRQPGPLQTKAEPSFLSNAIKELDTYLGTQIDKNSPLDDEVLVEARAQFINILEAVKSPSPVNLPLPKTHARTFWQRLFNP
jgi:hypothetical protein